MKNKHTTKCGLTGSNRYKSKSRAGIALVEALVSLTLLAVFLTGAMKTLLSHHEMSDMARAHYTAINIAKNRMELIRTFDFGQVDDFLEDKVNIDASGIPSNLGNFRRSTQVINVNPNLLELSVIVEIRDRKTLGFSGSQEYLKTYFAEYLTEESSPGGGVAANSSS
jgi:hypothetical protein